MVVDSSAIVAVLLQEPGAASMTAAIERDAVRLMSVVNYLETTIVIESRRGEAGRRELALFLRQSAIEIIPADVGGAERACAAWRRFGRGNHPAKLNFGDCFAYALAMERGEPLLFKGNDFARTDVARCL